MTTVIPMQKDDIGVWKMAGKAFPDQQLKSHLAEFLETKPRPPFEDEEVYHLPTKGMPESVIDALFYVRSEGHAMYLPESPRDGTEACFQIDRPIYELIIDLLMALLKNLAGFNRGGSRPNTPGTKGLAPKPGRGRPLIGYDGGLEL